MSWERPIMNMYINNIISRKIEQGRRLERRTGAISNGMIRGKLSDMQNPADRRIM